jgi:DNA-binding protein
MEAVGQQAELHEIRIEDVKLRTEHLKAERQKRAKINAAEYKGVWPR